MNEIATLGGGCFWCLDAAFRRLKGVEQVVSGYAGGDKANPTYEEVCKGATGHAEVVQLTYAPTIITYRQLLEVFFTLHDPTTLNRQGNDIGPQYRSIILTQDETQEKTARSMIKELEAAEIWDEPVVTEVLPLVTFYAAEEYHQDYLARNPEQSYCRAVVAPKVAKFRSTWTHLLKDQ